MYAQDDNLYADDDKSMYIEEVYNMKMKKYYPVLKARAEYWFSDVLNREHWAEHVTAVQKTGEYNDIYVRLAWDMARMITTAEERCSWIEDCSANDKAFTTIAKKVGIDVGYF